MQITIDTDNLSDMDLAMLGFLADQGEEIAPEPEPAKEPAKETAAAKKKRVAKEAAAAEAAVEEDLVGGDGPTMSDAVAAATALVSSGDAALVKTALAEVDVKRVSEMEEGDIPAFLAALKAGE